MMTKQTIKIQVAVYSSTFQDNRNATSYNYDNMLYINLKSYYHSNSIYFTCRPGLNNRIYLFILITQQTCDLIYW